MKFKILTLLFVALLFTACGDSGTDPKNSNGDDIVLIGGTGAKLIKTAVNGQKMGAFLFASNWDGFLKSNCCKITK